ncbi:hypothetical protein C7H19_19290 [Aphanothece hegewaldii CCALA 016]|uniref:Uncharacterized protein n=1 Tax=Aphanothece hegewaldii CCALA 016 TaxID=2107694 RepID=A0A2T1LTB9_9CHRO|nr:hypothetical protein [Aphanothece hegewaldii]PSF33870.1 hypothetical protein C7H19_19290 [Aphanothece hegewaldii CCALA 016]
MRKPFCPIEHECPEKYCPNRDNCKDLTYSWEIPYYIEDGVLIVKEYAHRYDWNKEAQGLGWEVPSYCFLPSGDYNSIYGTYHDQEIIQRIKQAWFEAGWASAIPLTEKPLSPKKMKVCPKCGNPEIYRKHPHSLDIYCDRCGHLGRVSQVLKPFLESKVYRRKSPKGTHTVQVWLCPNNKRHYSFSITYGQGMMAFNEFPEDPYLSGCFENAGEALKAGIEEANR